MTAGSAVPLETKANYKWSVVAMLWLISFFNDADRQAIALASTVYVAAGLLLLIGIVFFVKADSAKMQAELSAA